jgi:hypothetical protein
LSITTRISVGAHRFSGVRRGRGPVRRLRASFCQGYPAACRDLGYSEHYEDCEAGRGREGLAFDDGDDSIDGLGDGPSGIRVPWQTEPGDLPKPYSTPLVQIW